MGMSASQARLLSITARISDIEYKSQTISNVKIRLADESEQLAINYTNALNKQKITYTTYTDSEHGGQAYKVDLTPDQLAKYGFRLVKVSDGSDVSDSLKNVNSSQMYEMIESGEYIMQQYKLPEEEISSFERGKSYAYYDEKDKIYKKVQVGDAFDSNKKYMIAEDVTVSGNYQLGIESDQTELAKAEAEYNAATMKINKKEKLLDNELKALDTEHNALKTEFDSIKSLIGDNVEKSFNLFS